MPPDQGAEREDAANGERAISVNGVPIRLTEERWEHIVEDHDDLDGYRADCANVVEDPDFVLRGHMGALIAVKGYGRDRYLAVIYREESDDDGFVITAYFTDTINRKSIVWRP